MEVLQTAILGLVQGLCEFLPISSSGHLVLFQNIFGLHEAPLFTDTMLHIGTLIAVVLVLHKDIIAIFRRPYKMFWMLVAATIPTVIIAVLFKKPIEEMFGGRLLGFEFLLTAVILTVCELVPHGKKQLRDMKVTDALVMGVMQGIAIPPGVSRSGATIAGGLFCKLDRTFVARFSFLMSIPAIIGSVVFQVPDLMESGVGHINWLALIVGVIVAAISGIFAIRFMLRLISKKKLYPFAIYVAILGIFILIDQLFLHAFMPAL